MRIEAAEVATSIMTSKKIQAIRGMNDILPDEAPLWEFFEDTQRDRKSVM